MNSFSDPDKHLDLRSLLDFTSLNYKRTKGYTESHLSNFDDMLEGDESTYEKDNIILESNTEIPSSPNESEGSRKIRLENYILRYHEDALIKTLEISRKQKVERRSIYQQYSMLLEIDPLKLIHHDVQLGQDILGGFQNHILNLISSVCLEILRSRSGPDHTIFSEQLHLIVRLEYFPSFLERQVDSPSKCLSQLQTAKEALNSEFFQITGIIVETCDPVHNLIDQTYKCNNSGCNNPNYIYIATIQNGFKVTRRSVLNTFIDIIYINHTKHIDKICLTCQKEMSELSNDRVYLDRQTVILQSLESKMNGCYFNRVSLELQSEMVNGLHKGAVVEVVGIVRRRVIDSVENRFRAYDNNLVFSRVNYSSFPEKTAPFIVKDWRPRISVFPTDSICGPTILDKIKKLDIWTYSQYMIDRFSGDMLPKSLWRTLKMSLLLSLVLVDSESSEQSQQKLNIMAITYGRIPVLQRFLNYASAFSPSIHSSFLPSGVKFHQLFQSRGDCFPLSRNGIFVFDFSILKQQDYPFLSSILTSESTHDEEEGSTTNILNTCFWSYADNIITCETKKSHKHPNQHSDVTSLCLNQLFPIVLPIYMSQEQDSLLASHLLQNSSDGITNDLSDLTRFIQLARATKTRLSPECEFLLKKYFLAYRRFMVQNMVQDGSLTTMKTLISLATAYSKLRLNELVGVEEAVMRDSIIMFDVIICGKYNRSLLMAQCDSNDSYASIVEIFSYPYSDILTQVINQLNDLPC